MYYCHLILILQLYFDYRCISNTKVINGLILTLDICDYFTLNVFEKYSPLLSDHNLTITMLLGCNVLSDTEWPIVLDVNLLTPYLLLAYYNYGGM